VILSVSAVRVPSRLTREAFGLSGPGTQRGAAAGSPPHMSALHGHAPAGASIDRVALRAVLAACRMANAPNTSKETL
jgi:hypothetical protein